MLILSGIPDTDMFYTQTKMSVSKRGSLCYKYSYAVSDTAAKYLMPFSPMFAHYIGLVLAAHTSQKGLIVSKERIHNGSPIRRKMVTREMDLGSFS